MTPAVLFIIFNRPETTRLVFEVIRLARPKRLYIAGDGPRLGKVGEQEVCDETRKIVEKIDWPCEVKTLFQEANLGCRQGVSTAITWFFDNEEEGIILEDDIVPDASFFPYCAELLERHRDNPKIMAITGLNRQPNNRDYDHSYYFSCYNHVWGWASWRRAWAVYDRTLDTLESVETAEVLDQLSDVPGFKEYWMKNFRAVRDEKIDTWDYSWLLTCWMHGGLTCTPSQNLIQNIGFGSDATHTVNPNSKHAQMVAQPLTLPLTHPEIIERSRRNDDYVSKMEYGINLRRYMKNGLRALINRWKS